MCGMQPACTGVQPALAPALLGSLDTGLRVADKGSGEMAHPGLLGRDDLLCQHLRLLPDLMGESSEYKEREVCSLSFCLYTTHRNTF